VTQPADLAQSMDSRADALAVDTGVTSSFDFHLAMLS
jgi:hypothetical protein